MIPAGHEESLSQQYPRPDAPTYRGQTLQRKNVLKSLMDCGNAVEHEEHRHSYSECSRLDCATVGVQH